jgi:hypothetical protein
MNLKSKCVERKGFYANLKRKTYKLCELIEKQIVKVQQFFTIDLDIP